ncbi:MAG: hypothetical protein AAF762_10610, partial [Pseudomonadota bacterium]
RGRPKLSDKLQSIDCYRAWHVQGLAKAIRLAGRKVPSQRKLIEIAMHLERQNAKAIEHRAFTINTKSAIEQSVSRGKKILGIRGDWTGGIVDHDL